MTPQEKAPPGGQGQKTVCSIKSESRLLKTGEPDYSGKLHRGRP